MTELVLNLGGLTLPTEIDTTIVAGWTGRDKASVEEHIAELAALGVAPPSRTPIFYRVSSSRATTAAEIESTPSSSGEVEPILLQAHDRLWVGAGSDHTDREVEAYGVAVSKQMCDKPVADHFWPFEEVAPHWDELTIRSWITEAPGGDEVPYQDGVLESLLPPDQLLGRLDGPLAEGTLMFLGTFAAAGGVRPAVAFRYELVDPVLDRSISGRYSMRSIPLVG
jgi:hypothetical protein